MTGVEEKKHSRGEEYRGKKDIERHRARDTGRKTREKREKRKRKKDVQR